MLLKLELEDVTADISSLCIKYMGLVMQPPTSTAESEKYYKKKFEESLEKFKEPIALVGNGGGISYDNGEPELLDGEMAVSSFGSWFDDNPPVTRVIDDSTEDTTEDTLEEVVEYTDYVEDDDDYDEDSAYGDDDDDDEELEEFKDSAYVENTSFTPADFLRNLGTPQTTSAEDDEDDEDIGLFWSGDDEDDADDEVDDEAFEVGDIEDDSEEAEYTEDEESEETWVDDYGEETSEEWSDEYVEEYEDDEDESEETWSEFDDDDDESEEPWDDSAYEEEVVEYESEEVLVEEITEEVVSDKDEFDGMFEEDTPEVVKPVERVIVAPPPVETKKVVETTTQEEELIDVPRDIRDFVKKYPNCEVAFAKKYFTKQEIDLALRKSRIYKRKNKLSV